MSELLILIKVVLAVHPVDSNVGKKHPLPVSGRSTIEARQVLLFRTCFSLFSHYSYLIHQIRSSCVNPIKHGESYLGKTIRPLRQKKSRQQPPVPGG